MRKWILAFAFSAPLFFHLGCGGGAGTSARGGVDAESGASLSESEDAPVRARARKGKSVRPADIPLLSLEGVVPDKPPEEPPAQEAKGQPAPVGSPAAEAQGAPATTQGAPAKTGPSPSLPPPSGPPSAPRAPLPAAGAPAGVGQGRGLSPAAAKALGLTQGSPRQGERAQGPGGTRPQPPITPGSQAKFGPPAPQAKAGPPVSQTQAGAPAPQPSAPQAPPAPVLPPRNLFGIEEDPAVVAERQRVAQEAAEKAAEASRKAEYARSHWQGPPQPPPPPQPPAIPFQFIGYLGPPGDRTGVFSQGSQIIMAKKDESVMNQFKIVEIGYESAEIGFKGFKETQRIPLSGGK